MAPPTPTVAGEARSSRLLAAVFLAVWSVLLLARLGHMPLWDDEANTALFGQAFWAHGDTTALVGSNLVAYGGGRELEHLRNRYVPPLAAWMVAPFVGLGGPTALAARLPFVLCGLAFGVVAVAWLRRRGVDSRFAALVYLGLASNVSLVLYFRQCRWYSPAILLGTIATLLWLHRRDLGARAAPVLGLCLAGLIAANPMSWLAWATCAGLDHLVFGRQTAPLTRRELTLAAGPQVLALVAYATFFNPLGAGMWPDAGVSWLEARVRFILWSFRDLNGCEMAVGGLLLALPLARRWRGDTLPLRLAVAICTYVVVIAVVTPQPALAFAHVRYLAPLVPVLVLAGALVLDGVARRSVAAAGLLALLAAGTNVLHGGPLQHRRLQGFGWANDRAPIHSSLLGYARELASPPPSSYADVAAWLSEHVPEPGRRIWVVPQFATYPLMFHVPHLVYAWQLAPDADAGDTQFSGLPPIHFYGRDLPDLIVLFGAPPPDLQQILKAVDTRGGLLYEPAAAIPRYWYDLTRPELYWHSFTQIRGFDPDTAGVHIYRRRGLR